MSSLLSPIKDVIQAIAAGKMIILVDDEDRENEGDLVIAAEFATPEVVNFMLMHARGLVCLAMQESDFERLGIPMMVRHNSAPRQTAFGVSIEAREGVTTGISAFDRSHTILTAVDKHSDRHDLVMPGHVFPLCAKSKGVFERNGHTEGGVDLARLAGVKPASVICEIMNNDGTMARLPQILEFAKQHDLLVASIRDLQAYRILHEVNVHNVATSALPTIYGDDFAINVYQSNIDGHDYVVVSKPVVNEDKAPLVRLHSACFTGDVLGSSRCDCGQQLAASLTMIKREGGMVIYLPQEGRGIGLANKIKAYHLQDQGMDTVEANQKLGFAKDLRDYGIAALILKDLGVSKVRLMTNNPRKIDGILQSGIEVVERIALEVAVTDSNRSYLATKRDKLGHYIGENKNN